MATTTGPEPDQAQGGPCDGAELGTGWPEDYLVHMADGSRHRYVRTDARNGRARLYDYAGRQ